LRRYEEDDVFTLDAPVEDIDEDDEDNVLDDEEDNVFEGSRTCWLRILFWDLSQCV
jgi:hypothetical protein